MKRAKLYFDGISYYDEDIFNLCEAVCNRRNVELYDYKIQRDSMVIYIFNLTGNLEHLIPFENLKDYTFKYEIILSDSRPFVIDRHNKEYTIGEILKLAYTMAKHEGLRFTNYRKDRNQILYFYFTDGQNRYVTTVSVDNLDKEIDAYVNGKDTLKAVTMEKGRRIIRI